MTTQRFWKLHGLGNDFIFFDALGSDPEGAAELDFSAEQVAALCNRHTGIGGDGVIVVKPSPRPECAGYMHYINADGTLAQMCGNGVRCFAKFLVDHGYVQPDAGARTGRFVADTLAGPKPITFEVDEAGKLTSATVNMGAPILDPALVPTTLAANRTGAIADNEVAFVGETQIESPWGSFAFTCVSMGNPHAVCVLDDAVLDALPAECFTGNPMTSADAHAANGSADESTAHADSRRSLATLDVGRIGAFFEAHEVFPEKTNVEFAVVHDLHTIGMRVFERGCGETHACGTGACATQVAANLLGLTGSEADLQLLGGTLHIALEGDHVIMTGPAREAFTGQVDIDALDASDA